MDHPGCGPKLQDRQTGRRGGNCGGRAAGAGYGMVVVMVVGVSVGGLGDPPEAGSLAQNTTGVILPSGSRPSTNKKSLLRRLLIKSYKH